MKKPGENLESPFLDQEIRRVESESSLASSAESALSGSGPGVVLEYEMVTEPPQEESADDAVPSLEYELIVDDGPSRGPEAESEDDVAEADQHWEVGESEEEGDDDSVEEANQEFDEAEDEVFRLRTKDDAAKRGDPKHELEGEEDFAPQFEGQLGVDKGIFTAQAKDRFVLLVAGHNYREHNDDYDELARNRARVIVSKAKFKSDDSLVFVWFSVTAGRVFINRRNKGVWKLNNAADWTPIDQFKFDATHSQSLNFEAINRTKHYGTGHAFKQNDANTVMSIVDVYDFILNLGRHKSGTLMEFSILSHGNWNGPILVNSYDNAAADSESRDPTDKDGRGRKDFLVNNIDTALIHDAFHNDGFSWMWGCFVAYAPLAVLLGVADSRLRWTVWGQQVEGVAGAVYKADGTTPDAAKFRFSFGKTKTEEFSRTWDRAFFPMGVGSFEKTFLEIKEFAKKHSDDTYYYALTVASDKPCFGPPLGTSTNYASSDPYRPGVPVVHWVERGKKRPPPETGFEANYDATINFFVKTMKMPEDSEKRGYVRYSL